MAKGKKGRSGPPAGKGGKGKAGTAGKGKAPAKGAANKPAPAKKGAAAGTAGAAAATGTAGAAAGTAGAAAATGTAGAGGATAAAVGDRRAAGADSAGPAKLTRAERLEAERRARRRRSRMVRIAIAVAVALIAGLIAFLATAGRRAEQAAVAKMTTGSCRFDRRADADDGPGRNHFSGGRPTYTVDPPAGGNHLEQVAAPGDYPPNGLPPDARVVHAMEHGFVVLWKGVNLSADDERKVKAVADRFEGNVLVVPRPSLAVPVAATTWHRRLLCGQVEEDALVRFVQAFLDKGPEKGFVKR